VQPTPAFAHGETVFVTVVTTPPLPSVEIVVRVVVVDGGVDAVDDEPLELEEVGHQPASLCATVPQLEMTPILSRSPWE
jgi:hypothetical protein